MLRQAIARALRPRPFGVNTKAKHPQYSAQVDQWEQMRDTKAGQAAVKLQRDKYLPFTSGHRSKGVLINEPGWFEYEAYLKRALFPDAVADTSRDLVGLLQKNPAEIELPPALEPMRTAATAQGESLLDVLKRINEGQLDAGRIGLLLDVHEETNMPFISFYPALTVWNWATEQRALEEQQVAHAYTALVLDETGHDFDAESFEWKHSDQQRVCRIGDGGDFETFTMKAGTEGAPVVPVIQGNPMKEVPFVVANAVDIAPDVGEIPLLGLSNIALAIYRGDGDYRHTLFMSGQDTLVLIGATLDSDDNDPNQTNVNAAERLLGRPKTLVGAGNVIALPNPESDAKYVGISGDGIGEQRTALENLQARADAYSARLLTPGKSAESGEALEIRIAARTATLTNIAKAGGRALEQILKLAAIWIGADPKAVKVHPNLKFGDDQIKPTDFKEFMAAKAQGLPLSLESIWLLLQKKSYTTFETYEDEQAAIEGEAETMKSLGFNAAGGIVEDEPEPGEGDGDDDDEPEPPEGSSDS